MTFRQHLAKTEIVAVAAFLLVAIALAGVTAISTLLSSGGIFSPASAAMFVFAYTLMIGLVPVVVYGAPMYAWLLSIGKASWFAALIIGLVPGLALLLVASDLGASAAVCGAAVALITHAACRRGSNNSFKPKPLRGSA